MAQQTSIYWLKKELEDYGSNSHLSLDWNTFDELCEQAKEMEKEQRIKDYNAGYDDAQCNHINDAENYANEISY
jgi:hypothetical protein